MFLCSISYKIGDAVNVNMVLRFADPGFTHSEDVFQLKYPLETNLWPYFIWLKQGCASGALLLKPLVIMILHFIAYKIYIVFIVFHLILYQSHLELSIHSIDRNRFFLLIVQKTRVVFFLLMFPRSPFL